MMDLIITAILAAFAVGVTNGVTEMSKKAVLDAYQALKAILRRKYGKDSKIIKAVDDLEHDPDFEPYRTGLLERIKAVKANRDQEVLTAARNLLQKVNLQPNGPPIITRRYYDDFQLSYLSDF